jgi:hypothetical protein
MRGAIHLVAILLTALGAGCATNVNVVFDKREDLSRYRTWDWFPNARADIDAPGGEAVALDLRLARLIEQGLLANGFVRGGKDADFFVSYRLALRQRSVVVEQPSAVYRLDSYSSQGSFLIEGSEKQTRIYRETHLSIGVTGARGGILWRAQLVQREEASFALKLNDAVAILLERFPLRRPFCDEADAATKSPAGGGGRNREGDSDLETQPDPRCPGRDIDSDRPGPEPLPRRRGPATLAWVPQPREPEPSHALRFGSRWAIRAQLTRSDIC